MCGFASILTTRYEHRPTESVIRRMTSVLRHRGPDDEGVELFAGPAAHVALGHRRLSIIDIHGGHQPMPSESAAVWIAYNGEVYNHHGLRKELESKGHKYRSRTDTETVLHAYEEWGPACVERLRGMFAFVIWDDRNNTLFAARDRLGIKPFYYAFANDTLLCASEIKAILASGLHHAKVNDSALREYMTFGYSAGSASLFDGIKRLPPGHWLRWQDGSLQVHQYWSIPKPCADRPERMEADYIDEFNARFRESIRLRLMSDVPLGVFLSGGIDSSAIAATMSNLTGGGVQTFSVGFPDCGFDETPFARQVSNTIGSQHHTVVLTQDDFLDSVPTLIWHEDEPIRHPSSVALYAVSKLAREHVKVVLSGEGSDELFAGYDRYWATLFNLRHARWYANAATDWIRRHCVRPTMWNWPIPLTVRKKIGHTFLWHSTDPRELVFDNFLGLFPSHVHHHLFAPDLWAMIEDQDPYERTLEQYHQDGNDDLGKMLYVDQQTYLVELLMKQDAMSMAASIESRVPFLDHPLVEFAAALPSRYKLRGRCGKYLLKRAMAGVLPDSILHRRKMGFPVPVSSWMAGPFGATVRDVMSDRRTRERGIFNVPFLISMYDEHIAGRRDFAEQLWFVFNTELWARMFIDGDSARSLSTPRTPSVADGTRQLNPA